MDLHGNACHGAYPAPSPERWEMGACSGVEALGKRSFSAPRPPVRTRSAGGNPRGPLKTRRTLERPMLLKVLTLFHIHIAS